MKQKPRITNKNIKIAPGKPIIQKGKGSMITSLRKNQKVKEKQSTMNNIKASLKENQGIMENIKDKRGLLEIKNSDQN